MANNETNYRETEKEIQSAVKKKQGITEKESEIAREFTCTCKQGSNNYQRYKWIFTSMQCFDEA